VSVSGRGPHLRKANDEQEGPWGRWPGGCVRRVLRLPAGTAVARWLGGFLLGLRARLARRRVGSDRSRGRARCVCAAPAVSEGRLHAGRVRKLRLRQQLRNGARRGVVSAPIACSLPGPAMRDQLAAIARLAQRALLSHEQDGRTLRLRYSNDAADDLEVLVARERECCAFLDFTLVRRPDAVHLDITAPPEAGQLAPVLSAHFRGNAAPQVAGCSAGCGCAAAA
jgi:hypothetical protein